MNISNLDQLVTTLATIFFVFILGFVIQNKHMISEQTITELSNLIVGVLLPLYLFYTTATTSIKFGGQVLLPILLGSVITFLNYITAILALKPFGVHLNQKSAFLFSNIFSNTAFLGIPVCSAIYGPIGAVYAVFFDFGTGLVILTLGIWILTGDTASNWKSILFNPLIWSVLLGILVSSTGLQFPSWVRAPFETLGQATLPFAILICGVQLRNINVSDLIPWRQLGGIVLIRLLVSPLIALAILILMHWSGPTMNVIITAAAMPVGLSTAIFTKKYGADVDFAAIATIGTTLFSLLTLPFIIFLLVG